LATENDDYARIWRSLAYLEEDIKALPVGLKGTHRLLHDVLADLTKIVSRLAESKTTGADFIER
jgi:hypothetical protein